MVKNETKVKRKQLAAQNTHSILTLFSNVKAAEASYSPTNPTKKQKVDALEKIMPIIPTTVICEQAFSTANAIVGKERASLNRETIEALMITKGQISCKDFYDADLDEICSRRDLLEGLKRH